MGQSYTPSIKIFACTCPKECLQIFCKYDWLNHGCTESSIYLLWSWSANKNNDKATVYDQVNAIVLAKAIKILLTPMGCQNLLLHRETFSFTNSTTSKIYLDGPTMMKLIFSQIKLNTIMAMASLKLQLETMKLHEFGNNITKMLTKMWLIHNTLK